MVALSFLTLFEACWPMAGQDNPHLKSGPQLVVLIPRHNFHPLA